MADARTVRAGHPVTYHNAPDPRERQPIAIVRKAPGQADFIIKILDGILALPPGAVQTTIFERLLLDADAVLTLELWASANNLAMEADGGTVRIVRDAIWHVATFIRTQPAVDVTPAAVRSALRAPHWTDDKTLTDEERADREQMEAGHA